MEAQRCAPQEQVEKYAAEKLPRTTSAVVTGVVSSVSSVPKRRSSANDFMVRSGTMKNTGIQNTWKKTAAGAVSCGALL